MSSGAPDYQNVFTLVTPVPGVGARDWEQTAVGPGGTPIGDLTNPMTTEGDMIYGGTSGTPERLAAGTSGYLLQTNGPGAAPTWVAPGAAGFTLVNYANVPAASPVTLNGTSSTNVLTVTGLTADTYYLVVCFLTLKVTMTSASGWVLLDLNSMYLTSGYILPQPEYAPGCTVTNAWPQITYTAVGYLSGGTSLVVSGQTDNGGGTTASVQGRTASGGGVESTVAVFSI